MWLAKEQLLWTGTPQRRGSSCERHLPELGDRILLRAAVLCCHVFTGKAKFIKGNLVTVLLTRPQGSLSLTQSLGDFFTGGPRQSLM